VAGDQLNFDINQQGLSHSSDLESLLFRYFAVMLVLGVKAKICGLGLATVSPWPWP